MSRDNEKSTSHADAKPKSDRVGADQRTKDDVKRAQGQPQKGRDTSKEHHAAKPVDGKSQGKSGSK